VFQLGHNSHRNLIRVAFTAMMYGLTMTLKNEIVKIAPAGRVNCIGPGWVKTVRCPSQVVSCSVLKMI
jgi:NAD(P)-dependent dehydrogenase (short-subunit alcohol dehydrogenase family)